MKGIFKKSAGVILATGIICTAMATGCTATENGDTNNKNTNANSDNKSTTTNGLVLEQQTLVDDLTGIQVTGKLPVGAEIDSSIDLFDNLENSKKINYT